MAAGGDHLVELDALVGHDVGGSPDPAGTAGQQCPGRQRVGSGQHVAADAEQLLDADHVAGAVLDVVDVLDGDEFPVQVGCDVEAGLGGDVVEHDRGVDGGRQLLVVVAHSPLEGPLEVGRQHHHCVGSQVDGCPGVLDGVDGRDRRGLADDRDSAGHLFDPDLEDPTLLVGGQEGELAGAGGQDESVDPGVDEVFDVVAQPAFVERLARVVEWAAHRGADAVQQGRFRKSAVGRHVGLLFGSISGRCREARRRGAPRNPRARRPRRRAARAPRSRRASGGTWRLPAPRR